MNAALRAAAVGSIVGRLACPASERATHAWLCERSALGELPGVNFARMGAMQLYRASDALLKHRAVIEIHLFTQAMDLFDLAPTVTLYDLTNTCYEGEAHTQPLAQRGHSKEKRSDCKLLTLGLALDASGFVRRSRVFAGNVREASTLADMPGALKTPPGALVVLDRGIATEAQVTWLTENDYRYLVVSRERQRRFDVEAAQAHRTRGGETVHLEQVADAGAGEVRLYCYSAARAGKERAIAERFTARFEQGLAALNEGLSRPHTAMSPAGAPAGPRYGAPWAPAGASLPLSDAKTGAPCTCARPRARNRHNKLSWRPWESANHPAERRKRSSDHNTRKPTQM